MLVIPADKQKPYSINGKLSLLLFLVFSLSYHPDYNQDGNDCSRNDQRNKQLCIPGSRHQIKQARILFIEEISMERFAGKGTNSGPHKQLAKFTSLFHCIRLRKLRFVSGVIPLPNGGNCPVFKREGGASLRSASPGSCFVKLFPFSRPSGRRASCRPRRGWPCPWG